VPSVNTEADKSGSWLTTKGLLRVPQITVLFWIIKGLSTAMGESTSDFLVHAMAPALAVILGFAGLAAALVLQFWQRRYVAWAYWLAVVMVGIFGTMAATFAMGTALGDFTAYTLRMGYFPSAALFAGMIAIPAIGYRWLRWNAIACFWFAYVITRPLGASIADGLAKPKSASGLGIGNGPVMFVLGTLIVVLVAYLAIAKADVQTTS
jgi:uncharacterized membrane-anchored protein